MIASVGCSIVGSATVVDADVARAVPGDAFIGLPPSRCRCGYPEPAAAIRDRVGSGRCGTWPLAGRGRWTRARRGYSVPPMSSLHRALLGLALAGLACGLAAITLVATSDRSTDPTALIVLAIGLGWGFIGTGLYAWWRRPENRMGALMVLVGFTWFLGALGEAGGPWLFSLGSALSSGWIGAFALMLVAFPDRRRRPRPRAHARVARLDRGGALRAPHLVTARPGHRAARPAPATRCWLRTAAPPPTWWTPSPRSCSSCCSPACGSCSCGGGGPRARAAAHAGAGPAHRRGRRGGRADHRAVAGDGRPGGGRCGQPRGARPHRRAAVRVPARPTAARASAAPAPSASWSSGCARRQRARRARRRARGPVVGARLLAAGVAALRGRRGSHGRAPARRQGPRRERDPAGRQPGGGDRPRRGPARGARARARGGCGGGPRAGERAAERGAACPLRGPARLGRARLVATSDAATRRIERDVHDGAQQRFVALSLLLRLARTAPRTTRARPRSSTRRWRSSRRVWPSFGSSRGASTPRSSASAASAAALESLATRAPVPVEVTGDPGERLPPAARERRPLTAAEALTNVARYAHATAATITLRREPDALTVEIADDGIGGADPASGSGLRGLVDRLGAVDGRLEDGQPAGWRDAAARPHPGARRRGRGGRRARPGGRRRLRPARLPSASGDPLARRGGRPPPARAACAKATSRGRYFMPQSGAAEPLRRDELERRLDPRRDLVGGLGLRRTRSSTPRMIVLRGARAARRGRARLRGLDRDLVGRAVVELGQERVAGRLRRCTTCGVAEAECAAPSCPSMPSSARSMPATRELAAPARGGPAGTARRAAPRRRRPRTGRASRRSPRRRRPSPGSPRSRVVLVLRPAGSS